MFTKEDELLEVIRELKTYIAIQNKAHKKVQAKNRTLSKQVKAYKAAYYGILRMYEKLAGKHELTKQERKRYSKPIKHKKRYIEKEVNDD